METIKNEYRSASEADEEHVYGLGAMYPRRFQLRVRIARPMRM